MNSKFQGTAAQVDPKTKKHTRGSLKNNEIAMKVKDRKKFEQKHKLTDGNFLTFTPHTAWVQCERKQPRVSRNSGFAFVPKPMTYRTCRRSQLNNYSAYRSPRRTGRGFHFSDIEQPNAPQHPMFKEDHETGLPKVRQKEA